MKKQSISRRRVAASIALMIILWTSGAAMAQMDRGPKTEKTYGIGLPRDHASQLFADKDYPVFPLKPAQEAYKDIDGARMKKDVVALSQIALRYRDTVRVPWCSSSFRIITTGRSRAAAKPLVSTPATTGARSR